MIYNTLLCNYDYDQFEFSTSFLKNQNRTMLMSLLNYDYIYDLILSALGRWLIREPLYDRIWGGETLKMICCSLLEQS
jgi:hypothetical protein